MSKSEKDIFTRTWITENAIEIVSQYEAGVLTIRGLHYRLVARGMTNSMRHYKRVVSAMIQARREGLVNYEAFSDHDREVLGSTEYQTTSVDKASRLGKQQVRAWMESYSKNRWENQENYPEIWIEKKALQGTFEPVCREYDLALSPCKGYPSLTFLNDAAIRFRAAYHQGKTPIILYFGDYDPSGEDIPRSIEENLENDFSIVVIMRRVALMEHQVKAWNLPPAPAKEGDSRTAAWEGLGQVELDAVDPRDIQRLCTESIEEIFDHDLYEQLLETEDQEKVLYRKELKEFVSGL